MIKQIRQSAVPLVSIETSDPAQAVRACVASLNGKSDGVPIVEWDIVRGFVGRNKIGADWLKDWYDPMAMQLPEALGKVAETVPSGLMVFMHNVQRVLERDGVAQGIWLCRDAFKGQGATLVLLGTGIKLPGELGSDVVVLNEPAPDRKRIEEIVEGIVKDARKAGANIPEDYDKANIAGAALGLLSEFDVEQSLSLSVSKSGIDPKNVWKRKIERLKAITGAEITIDNPDFSAVAGCENVKSEIRGFIEGRQRPGVVLFADEIEKLFAGAGTDLSGVSTNLVGQFLTWTAERKARGFLLAGVPGAGKTWTATCAAGEAKVPFIKIADIKGSLVGESEAKLRAILKAADALAGDGSVLLIASCNWIDTLSPDVMARFTMGTFFYDFPGDDELAALWAMYIAKFDLAGHAVPESRGWVGREIEVACWRAWQYRRKLRDVAQNIVPSCVAQKAKLEALRKACSGRFLSASQPGVYEARDFNRAATGRTLTVE